VFEAAQTYCKWQVAHRGFEELRIGVALALGEILGLSAELHNSADGIGLVGHAGEELRGRAAVTSQLASVLERG
jgi:hypothetical protein